MNFYEYLEKEVNLTFYTKKVVDAMKKLFVNELPKSDKKVLIVTRNSLDSILSEFLLKEAFDRLNIKYDTKSLNDNDWDSDKYDYNIILNDYKLVKGNDKSIVFSNRSNQGDFYIKCDISKNPKMSLSAAIYYIFRNIYKFIWNDFTEEVISQIYGYVTQQFDHPLFDKSKDIEKMFLLLDTETALNHFRNILSLYKQCNLHLLDFTITNNIYAKAYRNFNSKVINDSLIVNDNKYNTLFIFDSSNEVNSYIFDEYIKDNISGYYLGFLIDVNSQGYIIKSNIVIDSDKNKKIINLISESFNNFNKETLMKEIKNILEE